MFQCTGRVSRLILIMYAQNPKIFKKEINAFFSNKIKEPKQCKKNRKMKVIRYRMRSHLPYIKERNQSPIEKGQIIKNLADKVKQ